MSAPSLTEWQPIETAPKDGRRIIACVDIGCGPEVRLVAYTKISHITLWSWCLVDLGPEDCDSCQPILWMPLPKPPQAAATP